MSTRVKNSLTPLTLILVLRRVKLQHSCSAAFENFIRHNTQFFQSFCIFEFSPHHSIAFLICPSWWFCLCFPNFSQGISNYFLREPKNGSISSHFLKSQMKTHLFQLLIELMRWFNYYTNSCLTPWPMWIPWIFCWIKKRTLTLSLNLWLKKVQSYKLKIEW